jgi:AmiR/NasT family two-component response regulator
VNKDTEDKVDPQTETNATNADVQVTGLEAVQTEEETEADAVAIEITEEDPEVDLLQEVATETEAAAEVVVMMVARRNKGRVSAFNAKNVVISRETVLN